MPKKSNEAKIVIWTDTMRSEMHGTISAVVIDSFPYIMGGAEMRETALKLMQATHERLQELGK
jgi:hypothetical protein